jgi:glycine cleavage system H protein
MGEWSELLINAPLALTTHLEDLMDPKTLRYAPTHEWARIEGDECTVGITQFAVEQLTDIVYIDLPDVGDPVFAGKSYGEIESVKAVSDLYAPIDGEIVAINETLINDPTLVSQDPARQGSISGSSADAGAIRKADRVGGALREGSLFRHREVAMKYKVVLEESEEGFAASVPGLPGCHAQGATEAEALQNIADAIREYLGVVADLSQDKQVREVEVEV